MSVIVSVYVFVSVSVSKSSLYRYAYTEPLFALGLTSLTGVPLATALVVFMNSMFMLLFLWEIFAREVLTGLIRPLMLI